MKKRFLSLFLVLICVVSASVLVACDKTDPIVGKWELSEGSTSITSMEFTKDGAYKQTRAGEYNDYREGTWRFFEKMGYYSVTIIVGKQNVGGGTYSLAENGTLYMTEYPENIFTRVQ